MPATRRKLRADAAARVKRDEDEAVFKQSVRARGIAREERGTGKNWPRRTCVRRRSGSEPRKRQRWQTGGGGEKWNGVARRSVQRGQCRRASGLRRRRRRSSGSRLLWPRRRRDGGTARAEHELKLRIERSASARRGSRAPRAQGYARRGNA